MHIGQRITVDSIPYYVELIGPVTTLCRDEYGASTHFQTAELKQSAIPETPLEWSKRNGVEEY